MASLKEIAEIASFARRLFIATGGDHSAILYLPELVRGARTMDRHNESKANGTTTNTQERRAELAEARLRRCLGRIGLYPFFQRDPRGMPVYCLPAEGGKGDDESDYSSRGFPIPVCR